MSVSPLGRRTGTSQPASARLPAPSAAARARNARRGSPRREVAAGSCDLAALSHAIDAGGQDSLDAWDLEPRVCQQAACKHQQPTRDRPRVARAYYQGAARRSAPESSRRPKAPYPRAAQIDPIRVMRRSGQGAHDGPSARSTEDDCSRGQLRTDHDRTRPCRVQPSRYRRARARNAWAQSDELPIDFDSAALIRVGMDGVVTVTTRDNPGSGDSLWGVLWEALFSHILLVPAPPSTYGVSLGALFGVLDRAGLDQASATRPARRSYVIPLASASSRSIRSNAIFHQSHFRPETPSSARRSRSRRAAVGREFGGTAWHA